MSTETGSATSGGSSIADVPTPALALDRGIVRANTVAMTARMRALGVRLRPHVKTAKSVPVAALATDGNFGGITVSTLAEARYFAAAGYRDILYGVGIVPDKLAAAAALQAETGARVQLVTDDAAIAAALDERAAALGAAFDVLIEIDTGQHRSGLAPDADGLIGVAHALSGPGVRLVGVMTHAGQAYHCADTAGLRAIAEEERAGVVAAAERLRKAGFDCPVVSAGSTPTAVHAESLAGVTEMRPGVYTLYDLTQMALGACRYEDIALSVVATVIGHHRGHGHLVLDAGFMALSKDTGASEFLDDVGFGWLADLDGRRLAGLRVTDMNQEHGLVPVSGAADFEAYPIGSRVRIVPNHACATAGGYDHYHVIDGGRAVVDRWERCAGW